MSGSQQIFQSPSSAAPKFLFFFVISALGVLLTSCESTDPAGALPTDKFTRVKVFFATDRAQGAEAAGQVTYGGARGDGSLQFGAADVAIPDDHKMGNYERPTWWKLLSMEDPEKHVVILAAAHLDQVAFKSKLRATLAASDGREALVFVHGFNVTFDDALRRTAQLTYDLKFAGPPVLYSWPSEGRILGYPIDEANVGWTAPHFRDFLRLVLSEVGAERVHVVAHSMGNRAVVAALRELDPGSLPDGAADLRQVVFAAPDIDAGSFRTFAADFLGRADRYTLYASSNDLALRASKQVHRYPRAGESGEGLVVMDGIDTIDATNVTTDFLGHSYYGDGKSIISDLFHLIRHGRSPDERSGLVTRFRAGMRYWSVQP